MKNTAWLIFLIVSSIASLFFNLETITNKNNLSTHQDKEVAQVYQGLPSRLVIPAIGIDAVLEHVGVTPDGVMDVPKSILNGAWFQLGPKPGQEGSAVIAGHLNGIDGVGGLFFDLHKLNPGDKVFTYDDMGKITTFIVRTSKTFNPGYAEEVFDTAGGKHLNLVTCDGLWNDIRKTYSKRLVVFADIQS